MSVKKLQRAPLPLFFILFLAVPGCAAHPHYHSHSHQQSQTTVVRYEVRKAPPAPRKEVVVAKPGRGYVWVKGHYVWKPARKSYVWVSGKWVKPPRRGAVWVAPRYERRQGRVVFFAGYWK